jgi:hypothetical protein
MFRFNLLKSIDPEGSGVGVGIGSTQQNPAHLQAPAGNPLESDPGFRTQFPQDIGAEI